MFKFISFIFSEMLLQTIFLLLAVMLHQSSVQGYGAIIGKITDTQKSAIVNMHNAIRREVQPPASNMMKMVWSEEAAKNAEKCISKCSPAPSSIEERTVQGTVCGEIALQTNYPPTWANVIDQFSKGSKYFKYGVGKTDPTKDVYGYTQMIWHKSNQVGCATAICPEAENKFFHLCRYCPSGNIVGQLNKPYKEGPPCGECPNNCEDKLCSSSCSYTDVYESCADLLLMYSCSEPFVEQGCAHTCKCRKQRP
uniref:Serotriflin-like n=1 Tax=Pogona vitticeps TaxID=103695 RepID=A0A6J0TCQ7_9SAUR|nr:cysteine-rich venom protein-like isoform X1 [Pogona vitticeps]